MQDRKRKESLHNSGEGSNAHYYLEFGVYFQFRFVTKNNVIYVWVISKDLNHLECIEQTQQKTTSARTVEC